LVNKKEVKKKSTKKVDNKIIEKVKKESPSIPAVKPETNDTLQKVEESITSKVVATLAPEMKNAIQSKFEEMQQVFKNELQDIRKHMEAPADSEVPAAAAPQVPLNESGLTVPQAQEKAGLDSLLPIIQMLGLGNNQNQGGGLNNMFMEAIMRKSLADITRGDMMNEVMAKTMYKKMLGEDMPNSITETTDSLMNPLRKYGENAKKS
tara:strand:- start:3336 stop:3956 length:621 start_codon:yes stop_codon:yes gene_type:complete